MQHLDPTAREAAIKHMDEGLARRRVEYALERGDAPEVEVTPAIAKVEVTPTIAKKLKPKKSNSPDADVIGLDFDLELYGKMFEAALLLKAGDDSYLNAGRLLLEVKGACSPVEYAAHLRKHGIAERTARRAIQFTNDPAAAIEHKKKEAVRDAKRNAGRKRSGPDRLDLEEGGALSADLAADKIRARLEEVERIDAEVKRIDAEAAPRTAAELLRARLHEMVDKLPEANLEWAVKRLTGSPEQDAEKRVQLKASLQKLFGKKKRAKREAP